MNEIENKLKAKALSLVLHESAKLKHGVKQITCSLKGDGNDNSK